MHFVSYTVTVSSVTKSFVQTTKRTAVIVRDKTFFFPSQKIHFNSSYTKIFIIVYRSSYIFSINR